MVLTLIYAYMMVGVMLTVKTLEMKHDLIIKDCCDFSDLGCNIIMFILCFITTFYWPLCILIGHIASKKETN